jgi:hypothetical protein
MEHSDARWSPPGRRLPRDRSGPDLRCPPLRGTPRTAEMRWTEGAVRCDSRATRWQAAVRSRGHARDDTSSATTRSRRRRRSLRPRSGRTLPLGAAPAALVPHQNRGSAEAGQVGQRHPAAVLDPRRRPARRALLDAVDFGLDVDAKRVVIDREHTHAREADKTFEHDRCTVCGHRSPDRGVVLDTRILAGLLCCSADPHPAHIRSPG